MRREDALREILSCVFTRLSVEYINERDTTTDTITIRAKNGYFNDLKFSYASSSFQNTVCSLFWYGFHINNETISCQIVKKRSTKSRAKEYLSSNDIINNSIEYLEKKKIDIKQICKLCSKKVFDDFLLSLIVRRLIPAVFKHRYDQTPDKNDNIDEFIKEAYRLMRCDLVDFRFKNYMQSNETELEVVDKRWPKGLCNYKIRFKIHNLPIVTPWENTFIYIPRNLNKLKENKQNKQDLIS